MQKIIFIDIDGTLTDNYGRIPPSALTAIKKARANQHLVFLCSGRSKLECQPVLTKLEVDGLVAAGGSYVEIDQQVIQEIFFAPEEVQQLIQYLSSRQIKFYLSSPTQLLFSEQLSKRLQRLAFLLPASYRQKIKRLDTAHELALDQISKINFINKKIPFEEILADLFDDYAITPSTIHFLGKDSGEIMPPHVSKAYGIQTVLSYLKIPKAQTIGIGNGTNDIDLFHGVNQKVAVADADKQLKEMADFITDKPMHDGLYHIFDRLRLI